MKTILKALAALLALLVLAIAGFVINLNATWQKDYTGVEKPAVQASTSPEVIKRGEYLVHAVAHCSACHLPHDTTLNRQPGDRPDMIGGYEWKMGPFGTLYSRNITPDPETGIGAWTDGEIARAIRYGVGRDGKQLVFMTLAVGGVADEDLQAMISYLRSTKPVRHENKPHEPGLLLKFVATRMGPDFRKTLTDGLRLEPPASQASQARGEYLARGPGFCIGCHSPFNLFAGKFAGEPFSGSPDAEPDPLDSTMVFRAPNLTPDPETGHITSWSEDAFVARFQAGRSIKTSKMPWEAYREMTETDLRGIYRFLRALPPVKHRIGKPWRKADEDPL